MLARPPRRFPAVAPPPAAEGGADRGVRVVALTRGEERFVYLFRGDRAADCLARITAHAADPALSLTTDDAALLTERVRETA